MNSLIIHGAKAYVDFIIGIQNGKEIENIVYSFFNRSEISVRSVGANFTRKKAVLYKEDRIPWYTFPNVEAGDSYITKLRQGKETICHGIFLSRAIGSRLLITTGETCEKDLYSFLMERFNLPLLREWVPYIIKEGICVKKEPFIVGDAPSLEALQIYEVKADESLLEAAITKGLQTKQIRFCDTPQNQLVFQDMDEYFVKYGSSILDNIKAELQPLHKETKIMENVAFFQKRLFPQQANLCNAVVELLTRKKNYCIVNEGTGTGKTLQTLAIIEGYFNNQYLRRHPGAFIKDIYRNQDAVSYRNILMVPSHLVAKWGAYIEDEVPYASVQVIGCLKDLIKLRNHGAKREGKEYYIVSKDTCKLSYSLYPLPTQVKRREVRQSVCKKCGTPQAIGETVCKCGSIEWKMEPMGYQDTGLICPECGELLYPTNIIRLKLQNGSKVNTEPLRPIDFMSQTTANLECRFCGCHLWAPDCNPVGKPPREKKWKKMSHYTNRTKKGRKTSWILDNNMEGIQVQEGVEEVPDRGSRKYSLALFIRKYLKGYFDFAVFDEAHKFKSGASAQGIAMHQLIKNSRKQLALTGTIAGGYASDLFYLLFRLEPQRMRQAGYTYNSAGELRFVQDYGTLETQYEASSDTEEVYNTNSRGRMIRSPKCKPGISPLIFSRFLLDCAVFLDITDMSDQLPELKEEVITVPLEREIEAEYLKVRDVLKRSVRKEGKGLLGTYLQFSLSYPDKPNQREAILSPWTGEKIITPKSVPINGLLAKEKALIKLVKKELEERRCMFIYCEFTGKAETNITGRLKDILLANCGLKDGEVAILDSLYPPANKREEWIHKQAEKGVKIVITNPRNTETGLDFCFEYNGRLYNFPTIINYQLGSSLYVVMQANYRHYRLNQIAECRTFYLASENTIQINCIQLIANKQVATQVLQGKFSSEGLAALANGIDTRVALAAAQIENQNQMIENLKATFGKLNQTNPIKKAKKEQLMLTFYELTGIQEIRNQINLDYKDEDYLAQLFPGLFGEEEEAAEVDAMADEETAGEEQTFPTDSDVFVGQWIPQKRKTKKLGQEQQMQSLFPFF